MMAETLFEPAPPEPWCPFCGSRNMQIKDVWKTFKFVACNDCKAGGPVKKTEEDAMKAFMNRAPYPKPKPVVYEQPKMF